MPVYSNAAGASPGQHTIPNAILLSPYNLVKHICANFAADREISLSQSTNRTAAAEAPACPCFLWISVVKWVYYAVILTFTVSAKHFGPEQQFAAKPVRS